MADQRQAERVLALRREPQPGLLHHLGAQRTRERHRAVGRAGVHDHDLVRPRHRGQAPADVRLLVQREHDHAHRDAARRRIVTGPIWPQAQPGHLGCPEQPAEIPVRVERPGIGRDVRRQRGLDGLPQRVRVAGCIPAQGGAGDFPVLGGVAGDGRLPADPRLGERVAERLQARREVDGAAARLHLAQLAVGQATHQLDLRMAGDGRGHFRRVGRHPHPDRRVLQVADGGEQFGEALRHLLVGGEQHRAQDDGITGQARERGGGDRVRPYHDPAAQFRPDRRDALGHGRGRCDDHVRTAGGQVHHHRVAPDGGQQGRVEPSLLALGEEVQGIAQQGPPLPAGGDEPDVVERYPPTPRPAAQLPAHQPARSDPPPRADDLDILPPGAREIAAQLIQVPGGAAHLGAGRVHGHRGGHCRAPALSARRQRAERKQPERGPAPSAGHGTGRRPTGAEAAATTGRDGAAATPAGKHGTHAMRRRPPADGLPSPGPAAGRATPPTGRGAAGRARYTGRHRLDAAPGRTRAARRRARRRIQARSRPPPRRTPRTRTAACASPAQAAPIRRIRHDRGGARSSI